MTLNFEEEGNVKLNIPCESLAKTVIEGALDLIDCPYEAEVNLLLTENEEIQQMNRQFRQIDRPTDVLSFPMIEFNFPEDFSAVNEESDEDFNPESGELLLGDIVISKEKVIEQAKAYGHSVEREYAFLITHSVLHLSGYDHMEEDERLIMEQKQKEILTHLGILR